MRQFTIIFLCVLINIPIALSQPPKLLQFAGRSTRKLIGRNGAVSAVRSTLQNLESRSRRKVIDRTGKAQFIRMPSGTQTVSEDAHWDTVFGSPSPDNSVTAIAVIGSDIYVGGYFTSAGGSDARYIARWDGNKWSAVGGGVNGSVRALAVIGTDLYAGGDFTIAGDSTVNYIARWDGSKWSSLHQGMDSYVNALAVIGTHLYAGGSFVMAGGVSVSHVAKWDGSAWISLGTISGEVRSLVDSSSTLFAGGDFTMADGNTVNYIARWDGSAWSSLGSGMDNSVYALTMLGGSLYAGGAFTMAGGNSANYVAKWDGLQWTALNGGVDNSVYALATIGSDLYAGGDFVTADGTTVNHIARWRSSAWEGLGNGVNSTVSAFATTGSVVYVGGSFVTAGNLSANYIARYNGTDWASLNQNSRFGLNDIVFTIAVDSPNVYVGGAFLTAGDSIVPYLAKWNGTTWSNLGSGVDGYVFAILIDGTNVYVGGSFGMAGGGGASNIARWNGTAWSPLGSGMDYYVDALAKIGDTLYAGGGFTVAGGTSTSYIAQWDGTQWSAISNGVSSDVYALAVLDRELYVGGNFTVAGGGFGINADHIAKWDGTQWRELGSGTNGDVNVLAVSGNSICAGGNFAMAGGQSSSHVARWNGTTWQALGDGVSDAVLALTAIKSDIYAGGLFLNSGATTVNQIAHWNGSTWSPLGSGVNSVVYALSRLGSDLVAGGDLTMAGGKSSARFSRWFNPGFAAQPSTLDFGSVLIGSNRVDTIVVNNPGNIVLDISSVSSDNADFTVSPSSSSINAGSSSQFVVTFSPTGVGLRLGNIVFVHDAPGVRDTVTVRGSGSTPPGFSVSPTSVNFGSVIVAQQKSDSVIVRNTGAQALTITSVTSTNARFTVAPTNGTIQGLDSLIFTVTFSPTSIGLAGGSIVFMHDAAGSPDTVTVTGTGITPPTFSVFPASLNFGSVYVAQQKSDSVTVRNSGTQPLTLTSVIATDANFAVSPTSGSIPGLDSLIIHVTFTPGSEGLLGGAIIFSHDAVGSPDTVTVNGTGITQATFNALPDSLNFDSVIIGQEKLDSIIVRDQGTQSLTITSVSLTDSQFSAELPALTIPGHDSLTIHFRFRPSRTGLSNGWSIFTHSASGSPDSVSLKGVGVSRGMFNITQSTVEFDSVLAGLQKIDTVFVHNLGMLPLTISSVVSTNAHFSVQPTSGTIAANDSMAFRVAFTPLSTGTFSGAIVFTHDGTSTTDTLQVRGTGIAPAFSIVPTDTLSLGTLFVGQVGHGSATITNTGTAPLVISSVTNSDSQFNVNLANSTLAPSTSTGFDADFRPTSAGFKSTTITFTHNAASSPATLVITATAVQLTVTASAGPHGTISPDGTTDVNYEDSLRFTMTPDSGYRVADVTVDSVSVGPVNSYTFHTISAHHTITVLFTLITGVDDRSKTGVPLTFSLNQNYPNPFNPTTMLRYDLPWRSRVTLKIYNILGQLVATLVDEIQDAGFRSVGWDASQAGSGIYFYRLEATGVSDVSKRFGEVKKMILLR
ncbi:MAG: choice-of-anchor D domain-containing protein [Ignavibacteria bacterium]|nr:choice-of-anchor D domain-containing protein [Ignavibacteria bacterium]